MSTQTPWIKAQASGGGSQCVEMRRSGPSVEVRDTKRAVRARPCGSAG